MASFLHNQWWFLVVSCPFLFPECSQTIIFIRAWTLWFTVMKGKPPTIHPICSTKKKNSLVVYRFFGRHQNSGILYFVWKQSSAEVNSKIWKLLIILLLKGVVFVFKMMENQNILKSQGSGRSNILRMLIFFIPKKSNRKIEPYIKHEQTLL